MVAGVEAVRSLGSDEWREKKAGQGNFRRGAVLSRAEKTSAPPEKRKGLRPSNFHEKTSFFSKEEREASLQEDRSTLLSSSGKKSSLVRAPGRERSNLPRSEGTNDAALYQEGSTNQFFKGTYDLGKRKRKKLATRRSWSGIDSTAGTGKIRNVSITQNRLSRERKVTVWSRGVKIENRPIRKVVFAKRRERQIAAREDRARS